MRDADGPLELDRLDWAAAMNELTPRPASRSRRSSFVGVSSGIAAETSVIRMMITTKQLDQRHAAGWRVRDAIASSRERRLHVRRNFQRS